MQAFILAGGFATRLWPLTEKRAKPLLPLAGKPLLTHLVEKIPEGMPITVSTNAVFAKDFEKWRTMLRDAPPCHPEEYEAKLSASRRIGGAPQHDTNIRILIEDAGHEGEKLGALGAVAKWVTEQKIDDNILLLAGDNYIGFQMEAFLDAYNGSPLLALHDITEKEKAKQLGTVVLQGNTIQSFEEKPEHPRSTIVSTGCAVIPKMALPLLTAFAAEHPDNIGGIFEHFLKEGMEVRGKLFPDPWFDIGSFEAYLEATKALVGENVMEENRAPQRGAPTHEGNVFKGSVVLGKGSNVKKSTLKNVVLFESCSIEDCILENCILDNHCTLQGVDLTGKMLREGTTLIREIRSTKSEIRNKV